MACLPRRWGAPMDVRALVMLIAQEFIWQLRIAEGLCAGCGQELCVCPRLMSGKELEAWMNRQGLKEIPRRCRPKS